MAKRTPALAQAMPAKPLQLDLRDGRIPGDGRLSVQAGTSDPEVRDAYRASIRMVLGRAGGPQIVARLKLGRKDPRKLTPAKIHVAVQEMDLRRLVEPEIESEEAPTDAPAEPELQEVAPAMLGQMVNRYLHEVRSDKAPGTADMYASVCRQIEAGFGVQRSAPKGESPEIGVSPIIGDVPVRHISEQSAREWLKGPKKTTGGKPWTPQNQRQVHGVFARLTGLALSQEQDEAEATGRPWRPWRNFWRRDPNRSTLQPAPKKKNRTEVPRVLSRPQVGRILWAVRGTPLAAWVATGYYAGLRKMEAGNLRRDVDVDLKRLLLRIVPRTGMYQWGTKTDNSVRVLDISSPLARWYRAHIRHGYAGQIYMFHPPFADRPISKRNGTRWTEDAYAAGGVAYGRGVGLTHHNLRHTLATTLASKGWSVPAIAAILGDTEEEVMRTYLHAFPSDKKAALESMRRKGNDR